MVRRRHSVGVDLIVAAFGAEFTTAIFSTVVEAAHTDSVGNFEPPVSVSQTSSSRGTSRRDGNEAPSHIDQVR